MFLSELTSSPLSLSLLSLCAGLIVTLATVLVSQRRRLGSRLNTPDTPQQVATAAVVRVDHAGWHPDRRSELEAKLATLSEEHTRLQENHTILLARHKALIREFQRMQTGATRPAHPVTPRKMKAQA